MVPSPHHPFLFYGRRFEAEGIIYFETISDSDYCFEYKFVQVASGKCRDYTSKL